MKVSYSCSSSHSAESDWIISRSSLESTYCSNSSFRLPNLGNENPLEGDIDGRDGVEKDLDKVGFVGVLVGRDGEDVVRLKGGLDGVVDGFEGVVGGLVGVVDGFDGVVGGFDGVVDGFDGVLCGLVGVV